MVKNRPKAKRRTEKLKNDKMTEKEWWHVHIWPRMVALGLGNFKAVKNLSIALWR